MATRDWTMWGMILTALAFLVTLIVVLVCLHSCVILEGGAPGGKQQCPVEMPADDAHNGVRK